MANVFNRQEYLVGAKTGTCSGIASGTTKTGTTIQVNDVEEGTLSAYIQLVVATNTMAWTPGWAVSQDNSTFITACDEAALSGTATSGATGTTTLVISAPPCVSAWPYVQARITSSVTAAATGTGDTYDIRYTYLRRAPKL